MFYQLPRGNRKGLSREYLLLKYLSDRSSYTIQNRRCLLSWSINPIEYFHKIDERSILCLKNLKQKEIDKRFMIFKTSHSTKIDDSWMLDLADQESYDNILVTLSEYKERIDDFFYVVPKNDNL